VPNPARLACTTSLPLVSHGAISRATGELGHRFPPVVPPPPPPYLALQSARRMVSPIEPTEADPAPQV
jgi:hypothetical protein